MRKKPLLTGEQEDGRLQGLRLLARIIARHYLAHPELYPAPTGDVSGGADGVGKDGLIVNAAVCSEVNSVRKEANP